MSRLHLIAAFIASILATSVAFSARPNIVILLADDLGYGDVGFHGSDIRTPHIDSLAATGVRLEQFYVAPMCSPTRAGLMTGRYPLRFGMMRSVVPPQRDFGLDPAESTLPELLRDAGYAHRGVFGKWHLGHARLRWHPTSQGFTLFEGCLNGAVDYFTQDRNGQRDWHRNEDLNPRQGYTTDLIADAAIDFITSVPAREPYLAYIPFTAPHSPFQAKPEDEARYPKRKGRDRTYAAMVDSMDQAVGRILAAIEQRGDADNTLILFCSDNGGVAKVGDNGPQNGSKLTPYQGGIRVAAALRWPAGGITGGGTVNARIGYIDVVPTLMAVAGHQPTPAIAWDGINFLPALQQGAALPDRAWLTYLDQNDDARERLALNRDDFKLVIYRNAPDADAPEAPSIELFAIATDPAETTNLAGTYPDILARLTADLDALLSLKSPHQVLRFKEGADSFVAPADWKITQP